MPAFPDEIHYTCVRNYLRKAASDIKNCSLLFDHISNADIKAMNEKGEAGQLFCFCKIGTKCPCDDVEQEIEKNGSCHCELFRKKSETSDAVSGKARRRKTTKKS